MKTDRAFLDLVQRKIRFENKRRKKSAYYLNLCGSYYDIKPGLVNAAENLGT